jgi:hypothetical protein
MNAPCPCNVLMLYPLFAADSMCFGVQFWTPIDRIEGSTSQLGQSRKYRARAALPFLLSKADIVMAPRHVGFVPNGDMPN